MHRSAIRRETTTRNHHARDVLDNEREQKDLGCKRQGSSTPHRRPPDGTLERLLRHSYRNGGSHVRSNHPTRDDMSGTCGARSVCDAGMAASGLPDADSVAGVIVGNQCRQTGADAVLVAAPRLQHQIVHRVEHIVDWQGAESRHDNLRMW